MRTNINTAEKMTLDDPLCNFLSKKEKDFLCDKYWEITMK